MAFLVVLVTASSAFADPGDRAQAVVDALVIDPGTAAKLRDVVSRYDLDLVRLERKRSELRVRLVEAHDRTPQDVEVALDDLVANQRALARNENMLITQVRKLVPAKKAAMLLMLINATDAPRPDMSAAIEPVPCDAFSSMHGCRR